MKTLIIFLFATVLLFPQDIVNYAGGTTPQDTLLSKQSLISQLDQQIAEGDSLLNYLQGVLYREAYEKNYSVRTDSTVYFFRDEVIKQRQLIEMRKKLAGQK
jgi:hypothetical protein